MPRRRHVLVLNQYYWPGREATALLLTELSEFLGAEYDVTVVTGLLHEQGVGPGIEDRNGVRIIRVRSTSFDRRRLLLRGINYFSYLIMTAVRAATLPRPDLILSMTDPPIVGALGVALGRRFGAPVVTVSQDVFPEVAVALRRLDNSILIRLLDVASRWYLRNSTVVVAIGETMRLRLIDKGAAPDAVRVIPNWVDLDVIRPMQRQNEWSKEQGLDGKFVVMHSGNVGYTAAVDTMVRAATFLRDRDDIEVLVIGQGARWATVTELAERLEAESVRFLNYQPRARLALSLATGDLHVVGLAHGLAGYVVPSRLYGILAAGRPVLAAAEEESETAMLVREVGCGIVVPPQRPELLTKAIRDAADGVYDLEAMGRRARQWVEREGGREIAVERYRSLIEGLASTGAAPPRPEPPTVIG
jgi:glycosyltransferase involved in cell wall biosynthesis